MVRLSANEIARRTFYVLGSAALVVAALYLGQRILIPLALAVLLSFVLAPLVSRLERRGVRRTPAVLLVVGAAFLLLGLVGWGIASQATAMINDLPQHKKDVQQKIADLQGAGKHGLLATVQDFLDEVERVSRSAPDDDGPVVRVQPERRSLFAQLQAVLGQFLGVLSTALVVVLLVIALLQSREDLRNRLIRLAGRGRLTLTTRALDEAGQRIGAYLLRHSAVNAGFGAAVGLGLSLIGVPYPALWGLLAGALRFVPAVGVWLVAPFPAALAFIHSPGPVPCILVLTLFLALELFTGYLIEPRVCGPSIGVAPVPLLLAVMFWTGLWGIVGLVLATPMTVCLAVLGKHVRQLDFLAVLLGSRPALSPEDRYYQRLLARDRYEAEAVAKAFLAEHSLPELFDDVLLPALVLVRRGRRCGELSGDDEQFILRTTSELIEDWGRVHGPPAGGAARVRLLGLPACDGVDEVVLRMLRVLVRSEGHELLLAGADSPGLAALAQQPDGVIVTSLAPAGLTQARYLCRRLRAQSPDLRIVVSRTGDRRGAKKSRRLLLSAGADQVAPTLRESLGQVGQLVRAPVRSADEAVR
jgi:predicted PurR-regulated permease PerM/CheY-like chemotaxis protein